MDKNEAMIKRRMGGFGRKPLTQEEFIKKATNVHGNKYDYSKVVYKPAIVVNGKQKKTKICIICRIHGEFYQFSQNHLQGENCPNCNNRCKKYTKEEFIKKSEQIHGKKYDYSKVIYTNVVTKICIVCDIHGQFYQTPQGHLAGNGCHKCSTDRQRLKLEDFINKAKLVHGNEFNYSKVDYKNAREKICIICEDHGEFYQKPYSHLEGVGCPHCNDSKGESAIKKWLIQHNVHYYPQYKFDDLKGGNQIPLEFDFYIPSKNLLVEFDGKQHFEPVQFNGISMERAMSYLKRLQYLDQVKNDYCKTKSIPLLRIFYKDKGKISDLLQNAIGVN